MRLRLFAAAAASAILAACATPTGPDATGRFDSFQSITTSDFTGYERVQILRPAISPEIAERIDARDIGRFERERPLGQRDVDARIAELERHLRRQLGNQAQLVGQAGPGVLTVRSTIIELNANRPTQAEVAANPALSLNSIAAGDAGVRFELLEDGQLLAVIEDRDNITTINDPGVGVGVWSTANQFFGQTSRRLAALLEG